MFAPRIGWRGILQPEPCSFVRGCNTGVAVGFGARLASITAQVYLPDDEFHTLPGRTVKSSRKLRAISLIRGT